MTQDTTTTLRNMDTSHRRLADDWTVWRRRVEELGGTHLANRLPELVMLVNIMLGDDATTLEHVKDDWELVIAKILYVILLALFNLVYYTKYIAHTTQIIIRVAIPLSSITECILVVKKSMCHSPYILYLILLCRFKTTPNFSMPSVAFLIDSCQHEAKVTSSSHFHRVALSHRCLGHWTHHIISCPTSHT